MQQEIDNLKNLVESLQAEVEKLSSAPKTLDLVTEGTLLNRVPVFQKFTSGSPTTNGSISVRIEGRIYNIMTT